MASFAIQQELPNIKPARGLKKKTKTHRPLNRKALLLFLFLTIFACSGFYLKTEIPKVWEKINSPTVISTIPKEIRFDPSPVFDQVEALTKDLRGTYGLYVYRLKDSKEYGVYQKEIFPAASMMKLPVMLRLYQEAQLRPAAPGSAGQAQTDFLETKYVLREKDKVGGAGFLQGKEVGSTYTYRQLVKYMGQYSDNTANNVLMKVLGKENIQQTVDNLGMETTSVKEYETSPEDIGLFFRQLYKGEILNSEHREEILKFLTKTGYEDRIPAGIPSGVRVAHKIGTDIGVFSDAGIIFAEKPFVLVIMSKDAKESEAKEVLPKISGVVWEFENK